MLLCSPVNLNQKWLHKLLSLGYPGSYDPDKCYPIETLEVSPGTTAHLGPCAIDTAQSEHPIRNLSVKITDAGKTICYSGDGIPTDATRQLFEDANVLIHECYWTQGTDHGHASVELLLPMAQNRRVETLCLLHLGKNEKSGIHEYAAGWDQAPHIVLPAPGDVLEV